MDDIRIFARSYSVAQEALLVLDAKIRKLHLNLQNAKTRILEERHREISAALIDKRLSQIENIRDLVGAERQNAKSERRAPNLDIAASLIDRVLNEEPGGASHGQKITHARAPLKGLTDRVFRRLLTVDLDIGRGKLLDRLIKELSRNGDYKLEAKLLQYARRFPRKSKLQSKLMNLIQSESNVFSFQEAQILTAIRYQSRVEDSTRAHCLARAGDAGVDPQIRAEALQLLARCALDGEMIQLAERIFREADRMVVKKAATLILIRQKGPSQR